MPHQYRRSIALILWVFCSCVSASDPLREIIETNLEGNRAETDVQRQINALSDSRRTLFEEYNSLSLELESLSTHNAQLQRFLDDQHNQRETRVTTLEQLADTRREVIPLLLAMVNWLEQLTNADLPYRVQERHQAIAELRYDLDRGDSDLGERYNRILNHYAQAIAEGQEVKVYSGSSPNNSEHVVDFLRIGRLALFYQSPDGHQSSYWDTTRHKWASLNEKQSLALARAMRTVRKETPPDLLLLPLPAPSISKKETALWP